MFCEANNHCSVCDHTFCFSVIYRELLYEKKSNDEHYKSK